MSRTQHTHTQGGKLSLKKDKEGRDRRTCASCGWIFYNNPTPVVAAVVEHKESSNQEEAAQIVLVQNIGWPSHFFGLVTGFLEQGEDPDEGVLREVR